MSVQAGTSSYQQIKFVDGELTCGMIFQDDRDLYLHGFQNGTGSPAGGRVVLRCEAGGPNGDSYGILDPDVGWYVSSVFGNANVRYTGALQSEKNAAVHEVYGVHPLTTPLASTDWDGNDTKTPGSYTIDTSALFGVPSGIKSCTIYLQGVWAAADATYRAQVFTPGSALGVGIIRAHDTMPQGAQFTVACDANGDFNVLIENANMTNALLRLLSYTI
jgi:hypothetical protein